MLKVTIRHNGKSKVYYESEDKLHECAEAVGKLRNLGYDVRIRSIDDDEELNDVLACIKHAARMLERMRGDKVATAFYSRRLSQCQAMRDAIVSARNGKGNFLTSLDNVCHEQYNDGV